LGFISGKDAADIFSTNIQYQPKFYKIFPGFFLNLAPFWVLFYRTMDGLYWVTGETGITQRENIYCGLKKCWYFWEGLTDCLIAILKTKVKNLPLEFQSPVERNNRDLNHGHNPG
jgi:hypothetical protein